MYVKNLIIVYLCVIMCVESVVNVVLFLVIKCYQQKSPRERKMLVKLEQHDIDKFWPIMRKGLEMIDGSLTNPDKILSSLMNGSLQVWLVTRENAATVLGFITTQVNIVEPEGKRVLLVRDIFTLNGAAGDMWDDGVNTINAFAKSTGCVEIVGYSKNQDMISRAQKLGFDIETVLIKKEVV